LALLGAAAGLSLLGGAALVVRILAGLLSRPRPLHPRAQAVLDAVCANPGLSLAGVRQACGLANGVALHHLDRLVREGRIVAHRERNTLRFCENHGRYARTWRQEAARREPGNRELLAWLATRPGASQSEAVQAAAAWGWRRSLVQKRLARLADAGLLARSRTGRIVRYLAVRPAAPLPSPSAHA
jgi:DNA-binding MarR family transcriptional regulator